MVGLWRLRGQAREFLCELWKGICVHGGSLVAAWKLHKRYVMKLSASMQVNSLPIARTSRLTTPESLDIVLTGLPVPGFPAPLPDDSPFSTTEFFHDCPWLNVPAHRKADILIQPRYPRLGLLGGAPESGGKVSKLAALAAARKKKESEKPATSSEPVSTQQSEDSERQAQKPSGAPLSLRERLAASKLSKPSETSGGLRRLGKPAASSSSPAKQQPAPEQSNSPVPAEPEPAKQEEPKVELEPEPAVPSIRAPPSSFASVILGSTAGPTVAEPSHVKSTNVDILEIYGQQHAEPFDFTAPSPDDVVMNAQNTAKGLAIRRKE